ncbi:hypothetical protein [Neisseria zalophi]|uniref:Uncharacterized protein n=1 Tax=Neisseria zalophi TaxID=640030 RepID=A0A5J6PXE2_9NEIS|nr:hypothetical protein [Neisseria zalophi]QEY26944.1 hypothetical protein D0T92_10665 [Neisseria zalophi]
MKTNRPTESSKQRFLLKPKHLLAALFAIAVVAVGGVVIGIMHTSTQTQVEEESLPSNAASQVEVWAPQGTSVSDSVVTEVVSSETIDEEKVVQASEPEGINHESTEAKVVNKEVEKPAVRHSQRRRVVEEAQKVGNSAVKSESEQEQTTTQRQVAETPRRGNTNSSVGSARPTRSEPSPSQNRARTPVAETPSTPQAPQERPAAKAPQTSPPKPVGSNESGPITDNLF